MQVNKQLFIDHSYVIAAGLLTTSIWWFGSNNHFSFSMIFSFLIGATIAFMIGTIFKRFN